MNYAAPTRGTPVTATVDLPGSKSLANRALVLAAIADSPSTIARPLVSRDSSLMADALEALGARIEKSDDAWHVTPIARTDRREVRIDCGLAGTVMRFVPLVAALTDLAVTFDGDERARERPMGATIESLRALGVEVDDTVDATSPGTLPFTVHGTGTVEGGLLTVDAAASSQFVSAVLLVAPRFERGVDLRHQGGALPSLPHIDMTVTELVRRGVEVRSSPNEWLVEPGPVAGLDVEIEPDLSNAGPFIAAAVITGGKVRIRWPGTTDQAGDAWRWIVPALGGRVTADGADLVFSGTGRVQGADLDLHDVGELTPVVAAVAAIADSPSRLTGVAHLRGHETDRLVALATEINALGGNVRELEDGLEILPSLLRGGVFHTYDDHRMAHAGVVLGLDVQGLEIENIDTTAKTWPGFADVWSAFVGSPRGDA